MMDEVGRYIESTGGVVQPFKPWGPCHGRYCDFRHSDEELSL